MGELRLVDPETGRQLRVDTGDRALRQRFAVAAAEERRALVAMLATAGVRHVAALDGRRLAQAARRVPPAAEARPVTFEAPELLVFLLVVPVAVAAAVWFERRRASRAKAWAPAGLLANMVPKLSGRRRLLPIGLLLAGLTLLLVGFARPQATIHVKRQDATVVVVLDVSGSMAANDAPPTRLGAAQAAANRLVDHLPKGYRMAVITFSDHAAVVQAPTRDPNADPRGDQACPYRAAGNRARRRGRAWRRGRAHRPRRGRSPSAGGRRALLRRRPDGRLGHAAAGGRRCAQGARAGVRGLGGNARRDRATAAAWRLHRAHPGSRPAERAPDDRPGERGPVLPARRRLRSRRRPTPSSAPGSARSRSASR